MDTVGWVYYNQGKFAEAERQFLVASELLPKEAAIQYHLGLVAQKQGRRAEATTALKRALLLDANFDEAAAARKLIQDLGG
jgi:Tfp pilus assembly protein PilF